MKRCSYCECSVSGRPRALSVQTTIVDVSESGTDLSYYVDRDGRQHFNFAQCVWLDVSVPMAWTPVYTTALRTLAVNLLTLVLQKRDYRAAVGLTARRALALAPAFCEECLLPAPQRAWVLPRQAVRAWVASKTRSRGAPGRVRPPRDRARFGDQCPPSLRRSGA